MCRYARFGAFLLVVVTAAFHLAFVANTELDLFPDEAQYWDWSRRPDWSYYSKPPLVAYTLLASRTLMGNETPETVRLPAVVLGTATTLLVYRFAATVAGGPAAGLVAALAFRLTPLFASEAVATTTDTLLVFFWTLAAIFFYRAAVLGERRDWAGAGLAAALGLLSKYTFVVGLLGAAGFLRMHWAGGGGRGNLRWTLLALLVASLGLVPPLVWNVGHDWASFRHVAAGAGKPGHLGAHGLATAGEFLGSQALAITPLLFGCIVWSLGVSFARWRRERDATDLFLLWAALPMLLLYLGTSFVGRAEANWAAPAYVAGVAAFARHTWRLRPRLAAAALVVAIPLTVLAYDFDLAYSLGYRPKPRNDPTTRMRGWKELGLAVGAERAAMTQGEAPFVLADSYQLAAELTFYVPGQPHVQCMDVGRRRNQYDYWNRFSELLGRDAVYATEGDLPRPHHMIRRAFDRFERAGTVEYHHQGRLSRSFSIFRLRGFRGTERPDVEQY